MSLLATILETISILAFLFYGAACLVSPHLVKEFDRYRLGQWRQLVGSLEIAGALGLLVGQLFPPLLIAAAAGLAALMLCGLWARWRINDPWYAMLPALILGLINLAIIVLALR